MAADTLQAPPTHLMPSEQQIQQQIRLTCSRGPCRLHRNNTGTLRDQHGRPVSFGLAKGSSDLIGWTTRTITPEMVGQQVAIFTSIEVKSPNGRVRPEQRAQMLSAVRLVPLHGQIGQEGAHLVIGKIGEGLPVHMDGEVPQKLEGEAGHGCGLRA